MSWKSLYLLLHGSSQANLFHFVMLMIYESASLTLFVELFAESPLYLHKERLDGQTTHMDYPDSWFFPDHIP